MNKKFAIATLLPIGSVFMMLVFPLPTLVLDIIIAVNILFALTILIAILFIKEIYNFSFLPTLFFISTVFNTAVYTATAISIFAKGTEFDGQLIRFVSFLFFGSGENDNLFKGSALFIVIIAIVVLFTIRVTRDALVAFGTTLDIYLMQVKLINKEYGSGKINEEEAASRKTAFQKKQNFSSFLHSACEYISGNVKVNLLIIGVIAISGGLLIDILQDDKTFNEAAVTCIQLAVGSGILFMLPSLLLSIGVRRLITREIEE